MPYVPEHKAETRLRILDSARRLFNRNGLSEVSIDGVMAGAGLTRGGFYSYFDSKDELYAEAITLFTRRFPIEPWQCSMGMPLPADRPLAATIVDAYLSREHFEDVEGSCPMLGLPSDVARGGAPVKAAYREGLGMMVGAFSANLGPHRKAAHWLAPGIAAL